MRRYKPASGTPKRRPAPFPGGSKPVGGKGKGRGSLTMVDATTGKRVRKGPTPFPGSPPRGRTKRGKDGIDILIPDKPRKGKGKELKIGEVKQKKLSPAALRERRLRAAAERRKRLKEKKGTPKEPFNPIDKVPGGRPDPLLRARRRRAAALKKRRLAAANKANSSAVRNDNKQAASDLAKFNAARKRQAKKATPTARRTAKPVGDREVPVSRRVPFTGTGKPPTARRTAKPVGDRRVPVSRRIR